ncbi:MAG TPA: stage II sporulation protein M [Nanoarchaeota archaeon]|nr:stage II sporulation protein M [Nanoarchaeota archaeon]
MVLEDLVPAIQAEQKPWFIFPITFLYASIAIFLAQWIFPSQAAIVAVFLATLASMPLMISIIGFEKEKEERDKNYLQEVVFSFFGKIAAIKSSSSEKLLPFFIFMFLGFSVAFSFWFVVLPKDTVINLFYLQMNTIKEINTGFSGNISAIGFFFTRILLNNLKVLAFCVLFSIIYGAGAIFILVWNASVIGTAIGDSIKTAITGYAKVTGFTTFAGYSSAISTGMFRYMLHGIPEILAYFVGALAGGFISVAVVKHEFGSEKFENTIYNAMGLIVIAILILVLAAMLEVTISPMISAR